MGGGRGQVKVKVSRNKGGGQAKLDVNDVRLDKKRARINSKEEGSKGTCAPSPHQMHLSWSKAVLC